MRRLHTTTREQPPLATAGESLHAATRGWCTPKSMKYFKKESWLSGILGMEKLTSRHIPTAVPSHQRS